MGRCGRKVMAVESLDDPRIREDTSAGQRRVREAEFFATTWKVAVRDRAWVRSQCEADRGTPLQGRRS